MSAPDLRIPRSSVVGMTNEELCWAVVEPVWPDDQVNDELEHTGRLTPGQRAIYVTMLYAREVDNGGIRQFLSNSSSLYYKYVLEGLDQIGAGAFHQSLEVILRFLPGGKPSPDRADRKQEVAGMSESQKMFIREHEDFAFTSGGFEMVLLPRWSSFIQEHPDDFFLR